MKVNFDWSTGEYVPEFVPYSGLFKDIKDCQNILNSEDLNPKLALKQGIQLRKEIAEAELPPYLEYNAQERGDFEFRYAENVSKLCGQSAIWFEGADSGQEYLKSVNCRKQWCPVCGGKGGHIHDSRMHSILSRINPDSYNARQFVFTIPEKLRPIFKSRERMNDLFKMTKSLMEKFFGAAVLDKFGHIKKYKLEKPALAYLHAFGDKSPGVFMPHINIHILEPKNEILQLSEEILEAIKKAWLKKLRKYCADLEVVDVQYSFITKKGKFLHRLKYMCRPWGKDDYDAISDESLKRLLVLDLNGFQYFRYWGQLSNRTYKDEMVLPEVQESCEKKIEEKLIFKAWNPIDWKSYQHRLIKIDEGFYLVRKKGRLNESKESQEVEGFKNDLC